MKISASSRLFLTLSTHYWLTSGLPFGLRARSLGQPGPDYPIVNIADPEADVPGFSDNANADSGNEIGLTVTHTITRQSALPITATQVRESEPSPSPETAADENQRLDTAAVPVVGVKETHHQSQATVTVYHNNPAPSTLKSSTHLTSSSWAPTRISTSTVISISVSTLSSTTLLTSPAPSVIIAPSVPENASATTALPWTTPEPELEWSSTMDGAVSEAPTSGWEEAASTASANELPTPLPVLIPQPAAGTSLETAPKPSTLVYDWEPAPAWDATPTTARGVVGVALVTGVAGSSSSSASQSPSVPTQIVTPSWNGTVAYEPRQDA